MYVDGRTLLVLGNAGEGEPGVIGESRLYETRRGGELASDADDEAVPELACVCVPDDVCWVVVAVNAEGLPDEGIVRVVSSAAAEGPTVLAPSAVATGAAAFPSAVHGPEGRGGEGDEESGAVADGGGDVLAADQAGANDADQRPASAYWLLTQAGHKLWWSETVRARMPLPDERTALQLPDATPILHLARVTHGTSGRPLILEELRVGADRAELAYRITADKETARRTRA